MISWGNDKEMIMQEFKYSLKNEYPILSVEFDDEWYKNAVEEWWIEMGKEATSAI